MRAQVDKLLAVPGGDGKRLARFGKEMAGSLGVQDTFWSSPTGADGKVYCLSERGTVVAADAGDSFKILASIPMGEEPCRPSIAAIEGQLFICTAKNL